MTKLNPAEPPDSPAIAAIIQRLTNADIRWQGTLVGLMPSLSESAHELLAVGEAAIPQVIRALEEESKFVVAHVLLTLLSRVEYHTAPWNGLKVELQADGQTRFDPRQRSELARRWSAWQQTTPHPRSLFEE